jgi:acyl-Coa thioesterase superfamily protein/acyl-CoA thioesterase superfamily protein
MTAAFFTIEGEWFRPTDHCRGPWDPNACHAGPPAGLLARASEQLLPDQQLVRLTVDLTRPIPHAGFRIDAVVTRKGRTVSTSEMTIVANDGRPVVSARGLHLTATDPGNVPTAGFSTPRFADSRPGVFPFASGGHGQPSFSGAVEMRYPPGEGPGPGPTRAWMRTVPLLEDEIPSPFQRICPLADCGNAISRNANPLPLTFLNTDLTILLHRPPVGEWLGTDSVSRWEPTGIGMSDSLLFDDLGPVGRALQTLVITTNAV